MREITYNEMSNGILISNLTNSDNQEYHLGKYGLMRKDYLKNHETARVRAKYQRLMGDGTLFKHLAEVNSRAVEMMETLIAQMKVKENITEEMKNEDNLVWVKAMNNIKARAEEVVLAEIVFA